MRNHMTPQEVLDYLRGWTILGDGSEALDEAMQAVNERLQAFIAEQALRYALTIRLFPEPAPDARLLEIGSTPYLMSVLFEHRLGYRVSHVNLSHDERLPPPIRLENRERNESSVIEPEELNIEFDRLPFDDNSFDAVACCEIIEHLTRDPVWMLGEIHRVLKPEGCLVLTTPNVLRMTNVVKLVRGFTINDRYSRHPVFGAYGRHNREYAPSELKELLETLGFTLTVFETQDTFPKHKSLEARLESFWFGVPIWLRSLVSRRTDAALSMKRDLIFIAARKSGPFRPEYPDWLFYPEED